MTVTASLSNEVRRRLCVAESVNVGVHGGMICLNFAELAEYQAFVSGAQVRAAIVRAYMMGVATLRVVCGDELDDFAVASWIPTEGMARADRRNARYKQLALRRARARR